MGIRVGRLYRWANTDREFVDETVTDEKGRFSFPAKYNSSFFSVLFLHEPLIFQYIMFERDDTRYLGWRYVKHNYDRGGELAEEFEGGRSGKVLKMRCELTSDKSDHNRYDGICEILF